MPRLATARVTAYSLMALAILGAIYTELLPLFDMVTPGGQFEGFLSPTMENLETVVPLIIAALALGIVIWWLVSGAREEKARTQLPRRRR